MDYVLVAEKFVIGMLVMIVQINVLGKYEFSINSPLNQIQNYVLGGIIGGVIYNTSVTLLQFVIVLLVWSLVVIGVKLASESSRRVRALIEGTPQVVARDGVVDVALCAQLGLSAEQLARGLRENGVASVADVGVAVMESNGKLTILPRGSESRLPVIADGRVDDVALALAGHDRAWLEGRLAAKGADGARDVFLGEAVGDDLQVVPYPKSTR